MGNLLRSIVAVEAKEEQALELSFLYFFCILSAWYILQPLRDALGTTGGTGDLPWLFQGSLLVMILANGCFSLLVARYRRQQFIPWIYRFFACNLLAFFFALRFASHDWQLLVARLYFLWAGVFNLFAVSVFWAFMADRFTSEQGTRLFGFIGAGGTLGQIVGSQVTVRLATYCRAEYLILVAIVLLELAVRCVLLLADEDSAKTGHEPVAADNSAGVAGDGGATAALRLLLASRYLLGICLFIFFYTVTSSLLYFAKVSIAAHSFAGSAARARFFGRVNTYVGLLTLFVQTFATGRIVAAIGVACSLALVPAITGVGFLVFGLWPGLVTLVVFEVSRKSANYAIARPARELLYTVVSRDEKYKAKNLIDTFVYRAGDSCAAMAFAGLQSVASTLSTICFAAIPIAVLWVGTGTWLGRRQRELASVRR